MIYVPRRKEKFGSHCDEDVLEGFTAWCTRSHTPKGDAVMLGLWIVSQLDGDERQELLDMLDAREAIDVKAIHAIRGVKDETSKAATGPPDLRPAVSRSKKGG